MVFQESLLRRSSKYLIALGILAAVLVMNLPPAGAWVKNQFYSLTSPVQKSAWNFSAGISAALGDISGMRGAAAENSRLKGQITNLEFQLAQMNDLKKENQALRDVLNLGLDKAYDLKMAQIIGKDMAQDTLLLDKGSSDSIQTGYPVIDSSKAVVGRIVAVYDKFSKAALLTSKNSSFDVNVGDGSVDGLARGQGNFGLILDLVPKDKNISAGVAVVTSSLGGIFPKGLIVGNLGEVQKNDARMFQKAPITPAFSLAGATSVFVVMGVNAPADAALAPKTSPVK